MTSLTQPEELKPSPFPTTTTTTSQQISPKLPSVPADGEMRQIWPPNQPPIAQGVCTAFPTLPFIQQPTVRDRPINAQLSTSTPSTIAAAASAQVTHLMSFVDAFGKRRIRWLFLCFFETYSRTYKPQRGCMHEFNLLPNLRVKICMIGCIAV